jgi:glycosyltransferase involved in cell wall biosynthesis
LPQLLGGISKYKISVIGNWSSFEVCAREEAQTEKVIICPGAINKDKNQSLLVEAFAKIASEFPEWKFIIESVL